MSIVKTNLIIILLILVAILFRFGLSFLPAFEIDQGAYRYFSAKLTNVGIAEFYSPKDTNLNALGYFYPLWAIGKIKNNFFPDIDFFSKDYDVFLKIPAILTDIATGLLIYYLVKKKLSRGWGVLGFSMHVFNPAIFFNSSIWGQYDSISTFFLLLALCAIMRKNTLLMASFFAIALTLKPQAIFFFPIAAIMTLATTKLKQWLVAFCSFIFTTLFIYFPFFPKNLLHGIYFVNSNLANTYNCTTCFAFNFWGIFGNWQNDLTFFLGISKIYWGIALLILFLLLFLLKKPIKIKFQSPYIFLTTALIIIAFYTFLTRMHERYFFAFFPFLLLAAILLKSKILTYFYFSMSILHFLNLYYVYIYYNVFLLHLPSVLFNNFLFEFIGKNFKSLSLMSTLLFLCVMLVTSRFSYKKIMKKTDKFQAQERKKYKEK